jgi:hypothetical protein
MKEILGLNRILLIVILLALVGATWAYATYVVVPQREAAERNYNGLKSQVTARIEEIRKLKEEYAILQNQLRNYKVIEARGFFNDQNRVDAQKKFDDLQSLSGLLKASYTISRGELIEDPEAAKANYVVLKSPIKVDMEALDDVDVYNFIKLVVERYPGAIDLTSLKVDRDEDVSSAVLRQIGAGKPNKMITANINFMWRTMASRTLVDQEQLRMTGEVPVSAAADPAIVSPAQAPAAAPQAGGTP